jgi:cell division protein ZapD
LLGMTGKIGQYLRDNDWLMSIKSRAAIPGGVCEFDLPSYHWWLHRAPMSKPGEALEGWLKPMLPLRDAAAIVLRLLRSSGRPKEYTAANGQFQLNLGGSAAQMVRVMVNRRRAGDPRSQRQQVFPQHPLHQAARRRNQGPRLRARCRFRPHLL